MNVASVIVVVPPNDITEETLPPLEDELFAHLATDGVGIVLDLARVGFINSAGLGMLVKVGMRLDARGRRMAFACAQRPAERTIMLLGLDRKLPLFTTIDEARTFVAGGAWPERA